MAGPRSVFLTCICIYIPTTLIQIRIGKDPETCGNSIPYMFSKSAIGHGTASLAHELLPLGVRVNGIAPGFFVTEMTAQGSAAADAAGNSKLREKQTTAFDVPVSRPVVEGAQRAGTNKDMAALVLFLVSNWFVDGETVLIDGGVSVQAACCSSPVADWSITDFAEAPVVVLRGAASRR